MISGHYDIVCPDCGVRMGGCRCAGPNKSIQKNDKPCDTCKAKRIEAVAAFLEDNGVDPNTTAYLAAPPVPHPTVFEREGEKDLLTDKALDAIAANASYVGYAAQGQPYSVDMDLRLARQMQQDISKLIAEIRRLRALVPEDQRIPKPPETHYRPPPVPPPAPPAGFIPRRRSF